MRYEAANLDEIYSILADMPGPLAVLDFMTGELGYEVLATQCFGGHFYKKWRKRSRVVALCWKGCCLIHENVSDDQIELTSAEDSMQGNRAHDCGRSRLKWLREAGHESYIRGIAGVIGYSPPTHARNKRLYRRYGMDQVAIFQKLAKQYGETQYVFQPPEKRLIEENYIVAFCRNLPTGSHRNTEPWQLELFRQWANRYGLRLAIIADLWPREFPADVIHIKPAHRDLDLICNVVHHSLLYGGPASGASELAAIFGCNLVAFGRWPRGDEGLVGQFVTNRGFRYFGILRTKNDDVARRIEEYLGGGSDKPKSN